MRALTTWILAAALLAGVAHGALAQDRTTPGTRVAPRTPPEADRLKQVDGTVRALDRQIKWVRVSGGVTTGDTTLQMVDDTQILVDGRVGSLEDLREGDVVKAAYESRYGINLARSIEATSGGRSERGPRSPRR